MTTRRYTTLPFLFLFSGTLLRTSNTLLMPTLLQHHTKVTTGHGISTSVGGSVCVLSNGHRLHSHSISASKTALKADGGAVTAEEDVNALPDSKRRLQEVKEMVNSNLAPDVLNMKVLQQTVRDMEEESSQAEFWDNQEKAQALLSEMNRLKILISRANLWKTNCEDVEALLGKMHP